MTRGESTLYFDEKMKMKHTDCQTGRSTVLPVGATGLVGSRLVSKLVSLGHSVRVLTRDARKAKKKLTYGKVQAFEPPQWSKAIAGADAVINLAGRLWRSL